MTKYVALLRAVNVGGTAKLPMAELQRICGDAGFAKVRTYIASGNVVFESAMKVKQVKSELEARLSAHTGKPVSVFIRTALEMKAVLEANPFPAAARNRTVAIFLDEAPAYDALTSAVGLRDERICLGKREIYVHYGAGMGTSKLKIPAAKSGTARNINTIAKLTEMALQL